jgi:hypothetical protein
MSRINVCAEDSYFLRFIILITKLHVYLDIFYCVYLLVSTTSIMCRKEYFITSALAYVELLVIRCNVKREGKWRFI